MFYSSIPARIYRVFGGYQCNPALATDQSPHAWLAAREVRNSFPRAKGVDHVETPRARPCPVCVSPGRQQAGAGCVRGLRNPCITPDSYCAGA